MTLCTFDCSEEDSVISAQYSAAFENLFDVKGRRASSRDRSEA